MKKTLTTLFLLWLTLITFGQAKKPTIMIVPSDAWCFERGYISNENGKQISNYNKAFGQDSELSLVISKINGLMAERGFPLKSMESVLKNLETDAAEDSAFRSKTGASMKESKLDQIKKRAKADIIIQLSWIVNEIGPKVSISFNMQGIDSYSNKQVATAVGTGSPSFSAPTPVLLEEAVLAHIDNFNTTLQSHFNEMFKMGREIIVKIKVFDGWDKDLESEVGGDELGFLIEDWMAEHSVEGRFSTSDATESMMLFEQVRIPMYDERQRAMDTRRFVKKLSKYLKASPYLITTKIVTKGLGEAMLILGAK